MLIQKILSLTVRTSVTGDHLGSTRSMRIYQSLILLIYLKA
ncbi:hypothetical protein FOLKNPGA_03682 (plasmid) [Legionella sp. PC1000]|nr:hypothetical protein FOLKNPGA_03682 [Legionella sp. PC1000]